jgi:hypothetical protein
MNLQNILKTIASFTLLLTTLVVHDCLVTQAGATRPCASSVTAARPSELALAGGPLGESRAGSDGGQIERRPGSDGGPLGRVDSDGGPLG